MTPPALLSSLPGALDDAYPPEEDELGITRAMLELLVEERHAVQVVTNGTGVGRDIDLFVQLPWHEVVVSLCSLDQSVLDECDMGRRPRPPGGSNSSPSWPTQE